MIPLVKTIPADILTPVSVFLRVAAESKNAFLLESVEGGEKQGRFSFIGCDPFCLLEYERPVIRLRQGNSAKIFEGNPIQFFKKFFSQYRFVTNSPLPRFAGGVVGYVAYDAIRLIEKIPDSNPDLLDLPEIQLGLYDTVLAFDHLKQTVSIICNIITEWDNTSPEYKYRNAINKVKFLEEKLQMALTPSGRSKNSQKSDRKISSNITRQQFQAGVKQAQAYIGSGEIFQIVLSQRFTRPCKVEPFNVYRALRIVNPSPYMFYLKIDDIALAGSSPEMLVRIENKEVETRPIAGTRPRGTTDQQDIRLATELLTDGKERAEHVMLVDLGRNDIGRVSQPDSVTVPEFLQIERYSHVMHLVSSVRGKLQPDIDDFEAFFSCFPAGTVTGAPKIRAMELIDELENTRRGIYAGAICYRDFRGALDSCLAIRTILMKDQRAYVQVGAGIVADSIPQQEYLETVHKAAALFAALNLAERGW